jgi:hypothetical protein
MANPGFRSAQSGLRFLVCPAEGPDQIYRCRRAAGPHQVTQFCCAGSWTPVPNTHHRFCRVSKNPVAAARTGRVLKTARQSLLKFGFSFLRQATIRSTSGISEPHRRKTSGVQAARWSSVPKAKPLVECRLTASEIMTARRPVKRGAVAAMLLMVFSPYAVSPNELVTSVYQDVSFRHIASFEARPSAEHLTMRPMLSRTGITDRKTK